MVNLFAEAWAQDHYLFTTGGGGGKWKKQIIPLDTLNKFGGYLLDGETPS